MTAPTAVFFFATWKQPRTIPGINANIPKEQEHS
jgi:hypothetical protein